MANEPKEDCRVCKGTGREGLLSCKCLEEGMSHSEVPSIKQMMKEAIERRKQGNSD